MKKNYIPFAAGMLTAVLLAVLVSATLAKTAPHSGQISPEVSYGQAGVGLFLREQVAAGESRITERGASVPKVLTYTDEKGEDHYYIEAETVAEIFDVAEGVHFREELNRIEFGAVPLRDAVTQEPVLDEDGNPGWWTPGEQHDFATASSGDITVGQGVSLGIDGYFWVWRSDDEEWNEEMWSRYRTTTPLEPKYGIKGGMYTEVDPAEVDMGSVSGISMKKTEFKDWAYVEHTFAFTPVLGKYGVITMENVSEADVFIYMSRPNTVGSENEEFTRVWIPAGEKLVRAFRIDDEKDALQNRIYLRASTLGSEGVDLLVSAEQYRY